MTVISTIEQLKAIYGFPNDASTVKVADRVTPQYRVLIENSPFAALATCGPEGLDCSPRGDLGRPYLLTRGALLGYNVDAGGAAISFHPKPSSIAGEPCLLQRNFAERAQTVPPLFPVHPISVGPILCFLACDNQVESAAVSILPRLRLTFDVEWFQFPSHGALRPKPSSEPTVASYGFSADWKEHRRMKKYSSPA